MKKSFFAFVLLGALVFTACDSNQTPDTDTTKLWVAGEDGSNLYGYINASGKMIITPNYSEAYGFSCGWACVKDDGEVKYIDRNGKKAKGVPSVDGYFKYFYYNRISFRDDKLLGKFDNSFEKVIKAKYIALGQTADNGYCYYCEEGDDKFGFLDRNGKVMIEDQFDYAATFDKGLCVVGEANSEGTMRYGIINTSGDYVYDLTTKQLANLGESRFASYNATTDKCIMIDKNDEQYGDTYEDIDPFSCGLALVTKNGKYGFINPRGDEVIDLSFANATDFSDNVAWAQANESSRIILIDKRGNELISLKKDETPNGLFHNGLCLIYNSAKDTYTYINKSGDEIYSWKNSSASSAPKRSFREMSFMEMAQSENAVLFMERLHGLRLTPAAEVEYVY